MLYVIFVTEIEVKCIFVKSAPDDFEEYININQRHEL